MMASREKRVRHVLGGDRGKEVPSVMAPAQELPSRPALMLCFDRFVSGTCGMFVVAVWLLDTNCYLLLLLLPQTCCASLLPAGEPGPKGKWCASGCVEPSYAVCACQYRCCFDAFDVPQ